MRIAIDRSSQKSSRSATRTSRGRAAAPRVHRGAPAPARPPAEPAGAALERASGADHAAATGIPSPVRARMEAAFGADFSGVRVHRSSSRATALGALAYTQGSEIHVAPGQWAPETRQGQELLGHELAHVVQQRAGRVQATVQHKGVALNDHAGLEAEADTLGARAAQGLSASPSRSVAGHVAHAGPGAPVQLKSILKSVLPKKVAAETPIETLEKAFGKYYTNNGHSPKFDFYSLKSKDVSNYVATTDGLGCSTYNKPGEVVAEIDPASASKANSLNRDNNVILPYGHFGVMERAIFGRQDLGNTYDGGHLIEHTLMEQQDADVHGNIAPQESKRFNQGLMRGWEQIPEAVMHQEKVKFEYTMKVEYSDDTYERTGKQLVDAGVIPKPFFGTLSVADQNALENELARFQRWVPYQWSGKIDPGPSKTLASRILKVGTQLADLKHTSLNARSVVVDQSAHALNTSTSTPMLYRQNSGFLAGAISGGHLSAQSLLIPGSQTLEVDMFQPEPQDSRDQAPGPGASGGTPVVAPMPGAPPTTIIMQVLANPINFYTMQSELQKFEPKTAQGKRKADATVESQASGLSNEYKRFKNELQTAGVHTDMAQRASFLRVLKPYGFMNHLTGADVTNIIDKASFSQGVRNRLHPIVYDPNLQL